ncbi:hypothetical protein [Salipiger mangrovisoli]|uniref:Inner membrane protein n=1 Tax=Salipiger mangrovisoli TaxID=2865933 RepID=A0ABR9WXQ2_9RHOB|nr:hypothetical protein [Salipiger mangrovisoli]MBE9636011.1 hypothetical protein [Salipiger mangrovisoli]
MADKKKPLDDAKKQPESDQGQPPESIAPEEDAPVRETSETPAAGAEENLAEEVKNASGAESLEAEDTAPEESLADESGAKPGEAPAAEGVFDADDSLATGEADDTVAEDDPAQEPASSMESIHTAGEPMDLDSETDIGKQADTLIAAGDDSISPDFETLEPETPSPAAAAVPPREVVRETVVERKGGFVPMALGGVLAAALGWGASSYQSGNFPFGDGGAAFEAQTAASLSQQSERIAALSGTVEQTAAQVGGIDLSGLESATADLGQRMQAAEGSAASLGEQVTQLQTRIEEMQTQWLSDSVSPEAMAAYEKALADVRSAIETQRAEVEQMTQEALAAKQTASDQAMLAKSRTALSEINTALRDGAAYAEPLQVLQSNGVTVPEGLAASAPEGAPTQAALVSEFPPVARDALSAARRAEATNEDTASRVTTFLANQLGARSVEPREGDDPDAVLSRAEAALRAGDLGTVLSELAALPEPAQAELSGWTARAEARKAALDGADAVAQTLNQN